MIKGYFRFTTATNIFLFNDAKKNVHKKGVFFNFYNYMVKNADFIEKS
mgnify:CR=1 FL=1